MNDNHLHDVYRVISVNLGALVISVSGVEVFFRLAGLIAAFLYTLLKIYEWFDTRRNR